MNQARFDFIAQQIAPKVAAINVDFQPTGSIVRLACGHTTQIVPHFHVKPGEQFKCYDCGAIAARKLPEF